MAGERTAEFWDLYDAAGNPLGITHQRGIPLRPGQYHPIVKIITFNRKKEILLTKRHPEKSDGNCFAATGGCICAGEDALSGAKQKLFEETGIKADALLPLSVDRIGLPGDPVICRSYILRCDIAAEELTLQPEEVTQALWASHRFLEAMIPCGGIESCTAWLWEKYKDRILKLIESWNEYA